MPWKHFCLAVYRLYLTTRSFSTCSTYSTTPPKPASSKATKKQNPNNGLLFHRWLPQNLYGRRLQEFDFLVDLDTWSTRRTFHEETVEDKDFWKYNISCYRQGSNMTNCIKMWSSVLINDVYHDPSGLGNLRTTLQARNEPLHHTVERNDGMGAGTDEFLLDSYGYELDKAGHILFSRQYPLVTLSKVPVPRYLNGILSSGVIIMTLSFTSYNQFYFASLLRNSFKKSRMFARITSCNLWV